MRTSCTVLVTRSCVVLSLCICTTLPPCRLLAQNPPKESPWQPWQFLLGDWVGEGGGGPGEGTGTFSFSTDLQGRVLVRRNHSDFPPAQDRPAYAHDDLMVLYQEESKPTRAVYFDSEGHVIRYTARFSADSNAVVFVSDSLPGQPRFRLTYEKKAEGRVTIQFDFAPAGKPDAFVPYIKAAARKK